MPYRLRKWLILWALVVSAPDVPGVVELWEDDELVLVRSAHDSIRKSLLGQLAEIPRLRGHATHFGWEINGHPDDRAREILAEFAAEHHRAPRFNG